MPPARCPRAWGRSTTRTIPAIASRSCWWTTAPPTGRLCWRGPACAGSTSGAAAARNAGILAARHDLIACIDADCVADPGWLAALVAGLQEGADRVGGPIVALRRETPIERFMDQLYDQQASIERERPPYVITANLIASKSTLLDLGLFDERFLRGQDVELIGGEHRAPAAALALALALARGKGGLRRGRDRARSAPGGPGAGRS